MIVAIIDNTNPTGVIHVHEFRDSVDEAAAMIEFDPQVSADWVAVNTGWRIYQEAGSNKRWAYDFDEGRFLAWWTDLAIAKTERCKEIDEKTQELVVSGYPHNGRIFSSSPTGQRNIDVLDRNAAVLSYPFYIATRDNDEIYAIADAIELHTMYLSGLSTVMTHYQSGNALKQQVIDAATIAEVVAVADNR